MAEGGFDFGRALSGAGAFLEKIAELDYFCVLASAFFLLDNCLVLFFSKSVLEFGHGANASEISIANGIIFIFLLSFLLSFFFPFALIIINQLLSYTYAYLYLPIRYLLPVKSTVSFKELQRELYEHLNVYVARSLAIRHRDEFTLKRIEQYQDASIKADSAISKLLAFTCLLAINIWVVGTDSNLSINQEVIAYLLGNSNEMWGHIAYYIYWLPVGMVFFILTIGLCHPITSTFYYPIDKNKSEVENGKHSNTYAIP